MSLGLSLKKIWASDTNARAALDIYVQNQINRYGYITESDSGSDTCGSTTCCNLLSTYIPYSLNNKLKTLIDQGHWIYSPWRWRRVLKSSRRRRWMAGAREHPTTTMDGMPDLSGNPAVRSKTGEWRAQTRSSTADNYYSILARIVHYAPFVSRAVEIKNCIYLYWKFILWHTLSGS